jgi:tRNA A37 threonylcarbamoyladenosine dehydratase
MQNQFSRTEILIGNENIEKLKNSKVAIFGIGGVGSFTVEALARAGIGNFMLVDNDKICLSNINRQIIALLSTVEKYKVDIMKERILDINKNAKVEIQKCFFNADTLKEFDFSSCNYIVDAIDTISSKLLLVKIAKEYNVKIISCMGAGNKLDPTAFQIEDIYKTSVCPLARVMRLELKKMGIKSLKVLYSKEQPIKPIETDKICELNAAENTNKKRQIAGSISFVTSVAGLIIAGEVIKDLIKDNNKG